MTNYKRDYTCGQLNKSNAGETVTLCGWMHRRRDHGGLIFVDLRDRFGLVQLVFDPEKSKNCYEKALQLKSEWVVSVKGKVVQRREGMTNPKMKTGEIEIEAEELTILSKSKVLPFTIHEDLNLQEELRLKYRYLDLRKGPLLENLILRAKATQEVRNFLSEQEFIEVNTPILGKSTPEGARDYLVPSRVFPGNFYALPQSPQIFKQLLMVSGLDRYFQIAPCFRDEDLRSDRQPEFYQIDLEMSFGDIEDIFSLLENLMKKLFKACIGVDLTTPFIRISHKECLENYGTDKPDLRFGMPLIRIDDIIQKSSFSLLKDQVDKGSCAKALCLKGGAKLSRKRIEALIEIVKQLSLPGLAWMKRQDNTFASNVVKFFEESELNALQERLDVEEGDLIIIGCGKEATLNQALDHLRRHLAKENNLIGDDFKFLWVTDFPLFIKDPETGAYDSEHHPFTHPHIDDLELLDKDPSQVRSAAYDLVVNGYELGSGSQRIHDPEMQQKIFNILGLSKNDIENRFGFFVNALQYGTPPHLGMGLGLERIIMVLSKTDNIRDVIAFPKTTKASDLMLQAPSTVSKEQLKELGINTEPQAITWP